MKRRQFLQAAALGGAAAFLGKCPTFAEGAVVPDSSGLWEWLKAAVGQGRIKLLDRYAAALWQRAYEASQFLPLVDADHADGEALHELHGRIEVRTPEMDCAAPATRDDFLVAHLIRGFKFSIDEAIVQGDGDGKPTGLFAWKNFPRVEVQGRPVTRRLLATLVDIAGPGGAFVGHEVTYVRAAALPGMEPGSWDGDPAFALGGRRYVPYDGLAQSHFGCFDLSKYRFHWNGRFDVEVEPFPRLNSYTVLLHASFGGQPAPDARGAKVTDGQP